MGINDVVLISAESEQGNIKYKNSRSKQLVSFGRQKCGTIAANRSQPDLLGKMQLPVRRDAQYDRYRRNVLVLFDPSTVYASKTNKT